ncbi:MAG: sulfite exporter TauE/SafE family protein [Natrialbaceae archaeon]|nr:sulfite exporter TauE/SafE family protein [Natrialbaceae archaeon]
MAESAVTGSFDLLAFLLVGVLAGAHCLGMCGPLVSVYADRLSGEEALTPFAVQQHALFNLGRTAGYATVGAVFGFLGGAIYLTFETVTATGTVVRAGSGVVVGLLVIVTGIGYIGRGARADPIEFIPILPRVFRWVSDRLTSHVDRLVHSPGIVGLGMVHAILPCPIIYPAYLVAFAMGDPLLGALSLGVLGLGTIPTLFAYGTLVGTLSARRRQILHRGLGVAFIVLGFVPLLHGLMLAGVPVPHVEIPYQGLDLVVYIR